MTLHATIELRDVFFADERRTRTVVTFAGPSVVPE